MVPPDTGSSDTGRSKRLPTLSWTSVVDDAPAAEDPPAAPPIAPPAPSPIAPLAEPMIAAPQTAAAAQRAEPAVVLAPMTLSIGAEVPAQPVAAAPVAPIEPTVAPVEPAVAPASIVFEPMAITPTAEPTIAPPPAPEIRTFAPSPIVPVEADEPAPQVVAPVVESAPLPAIREATPVVEVAVPVVAGAEPTTISPSLPRASQPDQRRQAAPVAVQAMAEFTGVPQAPSAGRRVPRKSSRRGLKLVVVLVVLCALAAAGVVFGRPYLFPDEWTAATEPYARAVEEARGTEYVEPLEIVSEAPAAVASRAATQLRGDGDEATWRALGLLTGTSTVAAVGASLQPFTPVHYSADDGQVYLATGATGDPIDAALIQAMAAAALDQDHAWSAEHADRSLDAAAATLGEVIHQSREIQLASTFDGTAPDADPVALTALPALDSFRALAPLVFAEFSGPSGDENRLSGLGTSGPGLWPARPLTAAPGPTVVDGDVIVDEPVAKDRSFWYLVLAGYLDPLTAHHASNAIVESSLTTADRGATRCAYATFAGTGVDETPVVRAALEQWAATAPAELGAAVSVQGDGTLQLVSCDPGSAFAAPIRPTAARELLAWRTAELATSEMIQATDRVDPAEDFAFAWPFVVGSGVVDELVALPASTPPADIAAAARAAVERVFTPAG